MLIIGASDAGQTVELPVGQTMELRLEENPTTGFRWNVEASGEPACTITGDRFAPHASALGKGGLHTWQFRAIRVGDCRVTLLYRRSWEKAGAARTFQLHVRVTR